MVTFTTTVSRLLTEPRPWVTGCFSGTEQGSASTDAIVRPFILRDGYPTAAGVPTVSGWPMESPLAGSKKCRRLVSTASSSP